MNHFLVLVLIVFSCTSLAAKETHNPAPLGAVASTVDPDLSSPRKTFSTFLRSMNDIKAGNAEGIHDAVRTLDLSSINPLIRQEKGRDLAWLLLEAIDKTNIVKLNTIPNQHTGDKYIFARYKSGNIGISRNTDGHWQFSAKTLNTLPAIIDGLSNVDTLTKRDSVTEYLPWHIQFRQQLPSSLRSRVFLLENWKWLGILLVIAVGIVIDKLASFILNIFVKKSRSHAKTSTFSETEDDILRPLGMMAMAFVWWAGLNLLSLPNQAMLILLVAVKVLAGIAGVWGAYRLVDLITQYLRYKAGLTDNKVDDILVPLVSKTLKVFVTVIGITFVASNLNLNVSSLLVTNKKSK